MLTASSRRDECSRNVRQLALEAERGEAGELLAVLRIERDSHADAMNRVAQQVEDLGFAVVEDCLSGDDVTRYLDGLSRWLLQAPSAVRRGTDIYAVRNLVDLVPETRDLLRSVRSLIAEILGGQPRLVRALLFDKTPRANWAVPWHQDRVVAVSERVDVPGFSGWTRKAGVVHALAPASVLVSILTVRLHLDEDDEAGSLRVVPRSHRLGEIPASDIERAVRESDVATCRVPKGGALVMRPLLLHSSRDSYGTAHRRVVHLELSAAPIPPPLRWHLDVPV